MIAKGKRQRKRAYFVPEVKVHEVRSMFTLSTVICHIFVIPLHRMENKPKFFPVYKTPYVSLEKNWLSDSRSSSILDCRTTMNQLQHTPEYKRVVSHLVKQLHNTLTMPYISCTVTETNHYHILPFIIHINSKRPIIQK
jgi:hypothetical protein